MLHPHHAVEVPAIVDMTINLPGDFCAYRKVESALTDCGFSVGRMEAHSPTGVLFGDFAIAKWRNLSPDDREGLHGIIAADSFRSGPVRVYVLAPSASVADLLRAALARTQQS